jgi:alpha-mannosidase
VDLTGVARGDGRLLGMSICNDGKYSFAMTEKQINLTVLRSPIYAHHTPYEPQVDGDYRFIDQGEQRFRYRLVPHEGSWEGAETARRAAELNMSLISIAQSAHPGPLPQTDSYLGIGAPNIAVTVVKRAEEGDALILRCHETSGVATQAAIWLPHTERRIEASFAPTEIKTFRVPLDPERDVTETDLMEWENGSGGA